MTLHQHNIKVAPYRPDLEPGFWPNYEEPSSRMAAAIQYPIDRRFADRIINAYAQDAAMARKARREG